MIELLIMARKSYLLGALLVFITVVDVAGKFLADKNVTYVPTYYVDPRLQWMLRDRNKCLRGGSAASELEFLKKESATDFFRSHELLAFHYFVENPHNPHRRGYLQDTELEYIPLLPLSWIASKNPECSFKNMIKNILMAQEYLVKRDGEIVAKGDRDEIWVTPPPKFTVASTYNLRTQLGTGMPTQLRRGDAWLKVSNFIMQLTVGHYERWPQCPDLLRKSWKYVVELPYVALGTNVTKLHQIAPPSQLTNTAEDSIVAATYSSSSSSRKYVFFFSGYFELFGPELVCSVRNAVIDLSSRTDMLVVNTSIAESRGAPHHELKSYMEQSTFCIIAKGDSYSTASFYHALESGCIPVVISDWLVFSFPWAIPYDQFVVRIAENDFLKNPSFVLDHVKDTIGSNTFLLAEMRDNIRRYWGALSFEKVQYHSDYYHSLMGNDMYYRPELTPEAKAEFRDEFRNVGSIVPFDLMLLEIRYSQRPHQHYNNVPCLRPYMCLNDRANQSEFIVKKSDYTFYTPSAKKLTLSRYFKRSRGGDKRKKKTEDVVIAAAIKSQSTLSAATTANDGTTAAAAAGAESVTGAVSSSSGGYSSHAYDLVDIGYQVNPLKLPPSNFEDARSHLCRHNGRLIGSYKIVFFMQCVRILWPLRPGEFKPVDNVARFKQSEAGGGGPGKKRAGGGKFKIDPDGISEFDMEFVRYFHNFSRPDGWFPYNHPLKSEQRVVNLNALLNN